MNSEILLFFDPLPEALPLYDALETAVLSQFPDVSIRVQKTQISFDAPGLFLCVSLPRRKVRKPEELHIVVTFVLAARLDSDRIRDAVEPYPGRWTHHLPLHSIDGMDDELMGWIAESHDYALFRKRSSKRTQGGQSE